MSRRKRTPKEQKIIEIMDGITHFIVIYPENDKGDFRCALRAQDGQQLQDLLEAVVYNVADSIQSDPITLCKSMVKHLESILLPQSSGEIN